MYSSINKLLFFQFRNSLLSHRSFHCERGKGGALITVISSKALSWDENVAPTLEKKCIESFVSDI